MHRELLAEGRRRAVDESLKLPSIFRSALGLTLPAACLLVVACGSSPLFKFPDAGKPDGGVTVIPDSGVRVDGGLLASEACAALNTNRCAFLARCGLIEDSTQGRFDCARSFDATWCGPLTWPTHVAAGALKYDPLKAESCAQAFATQACSEWATLPDSCTRFLVPRVPLGQACYDGYAECIDGVCRGSSCPRTCQPRALLNDACAVDGDCKTGLYCRVSEVTPSSGLCTPFGSNGSACASNRECLDGLQCLSKVCRVLPAPEVGCLEGQCAETGYCDGIADAGLCVVRKTAGQRCLGDECEALLVCDPLGSTCVKLQLSSGDLCSLAQKCPPGEVCVGATAQSSGLCHAPQTEGARCLTHGDCEAHLACLDGDAARTCQRREASGVSCDSSRVCQSGAACTATSCTALPLPGQSCADTRACRWGLCRELANTDGGAVCGPLLSAGQPCQRNDECVSGSCLSGACLARCVP